MSKITKEIVAALQGFDASQILTDEGVIAKATELVDDTIAGRTITRQEVEQLRKDVESLKNTLEVVHVNLARAENDLATQTLVSEMHYEANKCAHKNATHWFDLAFNALNRVEDLTERLWNTEKELNDLKKEINKEPEFIEPPACLKASDALTYIVSSTTWPNEETTTIFEVPEPESRGNSWLLALLVLAILTGGAALIHYLSSTNLLKL